jgi:O-antigen/teichoic acid export membrane protein
MFAEKVENLPAAAATTQRATFFRQSGWLMIAGIAGGLLMWAVHFLGKAVGPKEYGAFIAFLSVAMCIPTMPLQMVLAHQTAKGLATNRARELAGMIRMVWLVALILWLVACIALFLGQRTILERWQMANATGLWVTMLVVLFSLWLPMLLGVLQGQQNFFWLGWSMMSNSIGRITVAALAVLVFGGYAAGMMTGALFGMVAATAIAAWHTRALWRGPSLPFDWRNLLREVIPPMLGFGAFQFLFTADTMFVKSYFNADQVGFYGSAGTLSRALMWLVGPLAAVMFPRIVHSAAKAEKSDLMGIVMLGTAILAILGAISVSIVGPFVVKLVYGQDYVKVAASVLPWYAGAMVPLALANVLLNNLFARSDFRAVPALCVLAAAYAFALTRFHDSLVTVLKTLGTANLFLLLICAWFTWGAKPKMAKAK